MARWHELESADEGFFETAPQLYRHPMDLPVPAGQVWAELTEREPLGWCSAMSRLEYTSSEPYGVGTTRAAMTAGGLLAFRERFFRWDEGLRKSFCVEQASLPFFRRFAEDYLVEPRGTGCRFTWTFAFEPAPAWRLFFAASKPVSAALFSSFARDTKRHFGAR